MIAMILIVQNWIVEIRGNRVYADQIDGMHSYNGLIYADKSVRWDLHGVPDYVKDTIKRSIT